MARWEGRLRWYFDQNRDEIIQYFQGLDRRDRMRGCGQPRGPYVARAGGPGCERIEKGPCAPWLADVGKLWSGYDAELNSIATADQKAKKGDLRLEKPGRQLLDSNTIDPIIPYFDTVVGVLLILGLFTRLASLAGPPSCFPSA